VWIDNYDVVVDLTAIGDVIGCGDLRLSLYQNPVTKANIPAIIQGVAWDFPIDINSTRQAPNENFGSYLLTFQKNGGSPVDFQPAEYTPNGVPGTPTVRVPSLWSATAPDPLTQSGILASWDIVAALDGGVPTDPTNPCNPPAATPWQIPRGCHCAYTITLYVNDNTWVGNGGDNHNNFKSFAVTIINDL
jgi:hypothetical protein